jgi:hypothetical protein
MSNRPRAPAPPSARTGSLYGASIGLKPGVVIAPTVQAKNVVHNVASMGVRVNTETNAFNVEFKQSGPKADPTALNLRGMNTFADRALVRITVWYLRGQKDRNTVLEAVVKGMEEKLANVKEEYEETPKIIHNQNCGSGWSSSVHYILVGKVRDDDKSFTELKFDDAGKVVFGVEKGDAFDFGGNSWKFDQVDTTPNHTTLTITLVNDMMVEGGL